jgi:hypothetical protein
VLEGLVARSRGRHGIKPLRAAVAAVTGEPPRTNSGWERDFLDDHPCRAGSSMIELDSWGHHRHRNAFENGRRKYGALQLAGYIVVPITWRRLETEPEEVAGLIQATRRSRTCA